MTMPHLMNCSHSDDSWCLPCVKALQEEVADWEQSFELFDKAMKRGTKMWHEANPSKAGILPDTGSLVCWLIGELDRVKSQSQAEVSRSMLEEMDRLRARVDELENLLRENWTNWQTETAMLRSQLSASHARVRDLEVDALASLDPFQGPPFPESFEGPTP